MHCKRDAPDRDAFGPSVIFVRPGGPGEKTVDAGFDLGLAAALAGHAVDAGGELVGARREVFTHVVQDLRAQVTGGLAPALGGVHRLDGIPQVLAIGKTRVPEKTSLWRPDGPRIAAVRAGLFAANVELGGAIDRGDIGVFWCGRGRGL